MRRSQILLLVAAATLVPCAAAASAAPVADAAFPMERVLSSLRDTLRSFGAEVRTTPRPWPVSMRGRFEQAQDAAIRLWGACLGDAAGRFEVSGESAEAVVEAAFGECQLIAVEVDGFFNLYAMSGRYIDRTLPAEAMANTKIDLRQALITKVVKLRSRQREL